MTDVIVLQWFTYLFLREGQGLPALTHKESQMIASIVASDLEICLTSPARDSELADCERKGRNSEDVYPPASDAGR